MMRKIKKVTSMLFACLFMGISLTDCTIVTDSKRNSINIVKVDAKKLQAPTYGEMDSSAQAVANGTNVFAFKLSAALAKNIGHDNFVCSPYSVWMPLAALVNATDTKNQDALLKALSASGISASDINRAASRMLYDLTKLRYNEIMDNGQYHNPLKIANAIFVGKNVTLRKDFAQTFMDFYRGNTMSVDFESNDAVKAVNQWANEQTEGLITDLVQEFDPKTIAAIANAIYFSDRWDLEFNPNETSNGVFHAQTEDKTVPYMLHESDGQTYYEDDRVQAMPLHFKSGGGMYIILPKSGDAVELLSSMTNDYFNEIQQDSIQATGKLLLPRFSIESDVRKLKDALIELGVPLFDDKSAPLKGGIIEENIPVWLSDAMQKAIIKVDEKGTTAAAVTIMAMAGSSMPMPTKPFEMICNKPFIFVLYENTYDGGSQVLFTGIVNKP